MNLKEKAKAVKLSIPALFIALKRKDTPMAAKFFAGLTVVYALSPIDLIPDFIPVVGYLDDIIILPLLAGLAIKLIPDGIMKECKIEAEGTWAGGKPEKWYYALPILSLWLIFLWWLLAKIIH